MKDTRKATEAARLANLGGKLSEEHKEKKTIFNFKKQNGWIKYG